MLYSQTCDIISFVRIQRNLKKKKKEKRYNFKKRKTFQQIIKLLLNYNIVSLSNQKKTNFKLYFTPWSKMGGDRSRTAEGIIEWGVSSGTIDAPFRGIGD